MRFFRLLFVVVILLVVISCTSEKETQLTEMVGSFTEAHTRTSLLLTSKGSKLEKLEPRSGAAAQTVASRLLKEHYDTVVIKHLVKHGYVEENRAEVAGNDPVFKSSHFVLTDKGKAHFRKDIEDKEFFLSVIKISNVKVHKYSVRQGDSPDTKLYRVTYSYIASSILPEIKMSNEYSGFMELREDVIKEKWAMTQIEGNSSVESNIVDAITAAI